MLKALTQYHELTGDTRVIPVMSRYFRYQLLELPKRPLVSWAAFGAGRTALGDLAVQPHE